MTSNVKVCILFSLVGMMTGFGSAYISASGTVMAQDKGHEDIIRFMKDSGGRHIDGEHRSGQKDIFQKKRELSHSDKIARLFERLMKRMEAEDYEELLQDILDDSDESYKNLALQFLMRKWVKTAPRHALRQSEEKGGGFEALFNEWADYDMKSFLEYVNEWDGEIPENYMEGMYTIEIANKLTELSPDDALLYVRKAREYMGYPMGCAFLDKVAAMYPERIKEFIDEMFYASLLQYQDLPSHVLEAWYLVDSDGLKKWDFFNDEENALFKESFEEFLKEMENRTSLDKEEDVLKAIEMNDYEAVKRYSVKELREKGLAVKEIIAWASLLKGIGSPVFLKFGEKPIQNFEGEEVYAHDLEIFSLIEEHRKESVEVLLELPEGEQKDRLARMLVDCNTSDDHEWKLEILQQIGDEEEKRFQVDRYLEKWGKIDKQGADAWRTAHSMK